MVARVGRTTHYETPLLPPVPPPPLATHAGRLPRFVRGALPAVRMLALQEEMMSTIGPFELCATHRGDCREVLATLPDASVHCCVTSPPYWGLRDYSIGDNGIGMEDSIETHLANIVAVFEEVRRVLRPDGTLWLNYGDRYNSSMSRGSFGDQAKDDRGYEEHGKV